jgi:hypothetical protein
MLIAQSAFPHYVDTDGSPITAGSLYYGTVGANPRTSPVAIYWDAAGTQPAPQPVRTVAGYPVRNGSPANVYINGAYSVALYNASGELVFYAPDSSDLDPVLPGSVTIEKLDSSTQDLINGALQKSGGTMTGAIVLSGNASSDLHAMPRQQLRSTVGASFRGLAASATGSSSTVSVSADEVVVRGASGDPVLLSGLSLSINSSTTGADGLDTGTLAANTWYAIWVIWNGTTSAGLLSLSSTSPTLPSGYTHKARVGWTRIGASNPLAFKQFGRLVRWGNTGAGLPSMAGGGPVGNVNTPTWVSVSTAAFAPTTAASIAIVLSSTGGASGQSMVAPSSNYGAFSSTSNPPPMVYTTSVSAQNLVFLGELLLESANVYWAHSGNFYLAAYGWEDNL